MECRATLISAVVITTFVYLMLYTHFSSVTRLSRLEEEVEQLTKVVLGRQPDSTLLPQIDNFIKKRCQGIWDELTAVKKRLDKGNSGGGGGGGGVCSRSGIGRKSSTDLEAGQKEEPNFALQSLGASIVRTEEQPLNPAGFFHRLIGIKYKSNPPEEVLKPCMRIGSCYAFKGDKSSFIIRLSHKITIRSITVEHIRESTSLTGDISNAPKDFMVYGRNHLRNDEPVFLGSFQYDNSNPKRAQTFHFKNDQIFKYCKVKIMSNYGNANYTCIYRVAVHGDL